MKAITIPQPYATLLVLGTKAVDPRTHHTSWRGPVAIHAGSHEPEVGPVGDWVVAPIPLTPGWRRPAPEGWVGPWQPGRPYLTDGTQQHGLPARAVIAVADIVDCVPISATGDMVPRVDFTVDPDDPNIHLPTLVEDDAGGTFLSDERHYGEFVDGGWVWMFDNVRPVGPHPTRGRSGLWNWEQPETLGVTGPGPLQSNHDGEPR